MQKHCLQFIFILSLINAEEEMNGTQSGHFNAPKIQIVLIMQQSLCN